MVLVDQSGERGFVAAAKRLDHVHVVGVGRRLGHARGVDYRLWTRNERVGRWTNGQRIPRSRRHCP